MTIKEKINKLNTAQVGSFGEYVFYSLCQDKKMRITPYRKERTDFLLNEEKERIDVKTYRSRIDFEKPNLRIYKGFAPDFYIFKTVLCLPSPLRA